MIPNVKDHAVKIQFCITSGSTRKKLSTIWGIVRMGFCKKMMRIMSPKNGPIAKIDSGKSLPQKPTHANLGSGTPG